MPSLYVHIPFCERKCFYCDFYSITKFCEIDNFLSFFNKEVKILKKKYSNSIPEFDTLYLGGGTPSVLELPQLKQILSIINDNFTIKPNAEVTIEANPNSVKEDLLDGYLKNGINRISIGVQSFISKELAFLQRLHSVDESMNSIKLAKKAGFENINIDLIFGTPNSTLEDWMFNLDVALVTNPNHISAYSLIYEIGTPLTNYLNEGKINMISNDLEAEMYNYTMDYLEKNGYSHYEVSNYAKPSFESKHNMNYWNFSEYIGLGPSAHSFLNKKRWSNIPDLAEYFRLLASDQIPVYSQEEINNEMYLNEIIMLGLRSTGIDLQKILLELKIDFYEKNRSIIDSLIKEEYITLQNSKISLTKKGFLICDEITQHFK